MGGNVICVSLDCVTQKRFRGRGLIRIESLQPFSEKVRGRSKQEEREKGAA